ncbi:MAG TPA: hydrolase [Opitutaceae bacterium]|nr:hydrolase [Opitutaceae bacterium]
MSVPAAVEALRPRAPELRDLLTRWCDQNSGSDNLAGLAAMHARLRDAFARLPGAAVESVSLAGTAARALRVRQRPHAPLQVFLSGHYDTVYGADDAFQRCEPVGADRLRGPGAADMKGGLVTMLAALEAFEQTPHAARLGYEVLLGPDEETGSAGTGPLFAEAAPRFGLGLVFEPARANGDLVHSRKGTGNFTVTSRGRSAHAASGVGVGRNAIAALAEFLVAAHRVPDDLPGVLLNIGQIRGGGAATNVIPDFAEAKLDVRVTRLADRAALLARLEALAGPINAREGHRLELTGGFARPPMERSPAADAAFAAWQQAARDLGLAPFASVHSGGASDANNLAAAGLPCLDGLGPIGDRLHSPDEWCLWPSIAERAQLAALFLHRLAAGEVALPPR